MAEIPLDCQLSVDVRHFDDKFKGHRASGFVGSEFGSRHAQHEKFYGGASFLVKQNVYRNFDFKRATGFGGKGVEVADGGARLTADTRGASAKPDVAI